MADKKIRAFGAKSNPSPERLKEFRSYVRQLKRQGILTGKIDPKVARPNFVRGGRNLADIVNRHRAKLKPVTPAKPTPPAAPKKTAAKAGKLLPARTPISFRDLPIEARSLGQAIHELSQNSKAFDKLKRKDEKFAFQIDGIHSVAVFPDMERLTNYLGNSDGIQYVLQKHQKDAQFIFDSIKLVRWNGSNREWKPKPQKWSAEKLARSRKKRAVNEARNRRRKKK